MPINTKNNLDYFKRLALKRINQKDKSINYYPITTSDLLRFKNCPLCKSSKLEIISEVYLNRNLNFFTTVICTSCLFTFRKISPKFSWFKKCWTMIRSNKVEVFNPKAEKLKEKRYQLYKNIVAKHISDKKMLDIGASYGAGAKVFKKAGFRVDGIEAEENKINYLIKKSRIRLVGTSIEKFLEKPTNKYDLVIFSNCLEHLDNPTTVVPKINKILNPGGIMLVSVPYLPNAISWSDSLYLTHKSNFSFENIVELIIKSNLEILEIVRVPYFMQEDYFEIAFVVRKASYKISLDFTYPNKKIIIDNIKKLYREGIPIKNPPLNKILKYDVPYIDQFYQVINMDKHQVKLEKGYITFKPKH